MTVEVTGEPLSTTVERLHQNICELAAEICTLHKLHAKATLPKLRNVASQILLVASGEPIRKPKSTRFNIRGVSDPSIQTAAASLGVSPQDFITAADGIVTRRNKAMHPSDVQELDETVEEVTVLITPALKQMAKWECVVVENYKAIKAAFKTSFDP